MGFFYAIGNAIMDDCGRRYGTRIRRLKEKTQSRSNTSEELKLM